MISVQQRTVLRGKRNGRKRKHRQVICSWFMGDLNLIIKSIINQIEKLDPRYKI